MNKRFILQESYHVIVVLVTATLYSLGVMWFLTPANLYAAGLTGLSQIIIELIDMTTGYNMPLGLLLFILNVPLFIYGFRKVSIRFAIYSLLSVIIQSIIMMGWIKPWDFGGVNPLENQLLFAIIGGLVTGVANGFALKLGTSTGGIDILAQALSIEKGISIGIFTMILNCAIAVVGGGFVSNDWLISMYTIIRIIVSSLVVDRVHTAYNYIRMDIVSDNVNKIVERITSELKRGVTLLEAEGAYTHVKKKNAYVILSRYELAQAKRIVLACDPNVFVVIAPVKGTIGRFVKKTIM